MTLEPEEEKETQEAARASFGRTKDKTQEKKKKGVEESAEDRGIGRVPGEDGSQSRACLE